MTVRKTLEKIEHIGEPASYKGKVTHLQSYRLRNRYVDGEVSREYSLDVVSHLGTDAVAVLPYWNENGQWKICMLKSFRPSLTLRDVSPEPDTHIYEAIAGVLENGENNNSGVITRACEELKEEAGIYADKESIELLGTPFYVSPGIYTERIYLACVELASAERHEPLRDGSVMEELLEVVELDLDEALEKCRTGVIREAKTELALRRLKDKLEARITSPSNPGGNH